LNLPPPPPLWVVDYNQGMTKDPSEILKAALSLPPEVRAALAGSLLDSIAPEVDEGADDEWRAEVRKRLVELDCGTVTPAPWAEVRARLLQQVHS
jgi:putative addiction module component (TIGR02574 family)